MPSLNSIYILAKNRILFYFKTEKYAMGYIKHSFFILWGTLKLTPHHGCSEEHLNKFNYAVVGHSSPRKTKSYHLPKINHDCLRASWLSQSRDGVCHWILTWERSHNSQAFAHSSALIFLPWCLQRCYSTYSAWRLRLTGASVGKQPPILGEVSPVLLFQGQLCVCK